MLILLRNSEPRYLGSYLKRLHRLQHRSDARNFMRAEQVSLAQRGQHGKERLGATNFVTEKFKGVRQGMAD